MEENKKQNIRVHLVVTAKWIVKELSDQIYNNQPENIKITLSKTPINRDTTILNYFFAFENFIKPTSGLDLAFFTHPNDKRFVETAKKVNHCVVMCEKYKNLLLKNRIPEKNISLIYPGVSEKYKPILKILQPVRMNSSKNRVIRKGKTLWNEVCSLPFVNALCTDGKYSEEEKINLYHESDIILSTSTIEGGPMCVLEGLRCGKTVIARRDVGFINDLDGVITYSTDEELFNILEKFYNDKLEIYKKVKDFSINNWVNNHYNLFINLMEKRNEK